MAPSLLVSRALYNTAIGSLIDDNNEIVLLAWAVDESENNSSGPTS